MIAGPRDGFRPGYTAVTREGADPDVGMDFGIHRLAAGAVIEESHPKETVWVLLKGEAELAFAGRTERIRRDSIFDEPPTALHVGPDTPVAISALSDAEWAVARAHNERRLEPRLFRPEELKPEYRGQGLAQDACLRNVRLIFDKAARPDANLVTGEVVNYPGRWSSYPPHHHGQPEIYHYRFLPEQGYGHAELGDRVFMARHNDTLLITGNRDHAQVSAPGYAMYYLWVIRHLPGDPYTGFTFTAEHEWALDPKNQGWKPKEGPQ